LQKKKKKKKEIKPREKPRIIKTQERATKIKKGDKNKR